jgi:hypothetical protein
MGQENSSTNRMENVCKADIAPLLLLNKCKADIAPLLLQNVCKADIAPLLLQNVCKGDIAPLLLQNHRFHKPLYYGSSTRQTPLRCRFLRHFPWLCNIHSIHRRDPSSRSTVIQNLQTQGCYWLRGVQTTVFYSLVRRGQHLPSSTPKMEMPVLSDTLVYRLHAGASHTAVLWSDPVHCRRNLDRTSGGPARSANL